MSMLNERPSEGIHFAKLGDAVATGAVAGGWVNMARFVRVGIVINGGDGANDMVVTLQQAKDNSGSDAKALNVKHYMLKVAPAEVFTKVDLPAPIDVVTLVGSAAGAYVGVVEVATDDLDMDAGFSHVSASLGDTGAGGSVGAVYALTAPRMKPAYEQSAED